MGLISLGCAKNLVDAEIMLGALLKNGVEITNDAAQADAVIVNTCSFIDSAQEESVDTILESVELRDARQRGQAVIVSGCLPQRFREELPKLLPEVDAFMGIDQVAQVGDIVHQAVANRTRKAETQTAQRPAKGKISARLNELKTPGRADGHDNENALRGTEKFGKTKTVMAAKPDRPVFASHSAADVHSRFWHAAFPAHAQTFCLRQDRRGLQSSVQLLHHSAHARIASQPTATRPRGGGQGPAGGGVKEINLISQDSTYYGLDLRPAHSRAISSPEKFSAAARSLAADATTICTLLRELDALPGDFWIRLLYTHPAHWTDELITTIAACKKVARYVDMPLQHIHENMLERMRRETSQQYIVDLIRKIRAGVPGIALRTTFIVGFPGETEKSFETLLDFIRETKFERLGVFAYSKEDGTRASAMAGQVGDKVKQKRRELAMAAQHQVAVQVSEAFVGHELRVLIEGEANAKQLQGANVSSWEHGLIRETDQHTRQMKGNYFVGRGEADAPDIDGRIYVRGQVPVGKFARVKIIGHTDYDLIGEPVARKLTPNDE